MPGAPSSFLLLVAMPGAPIVAFLLLGLCLQYMLRMFAMQNGTGLGCTSAAPAPISTITYKLRTLTTAVPDPRHKDSKHTKPKDLE